MSLSEGRDVTLGNVRDAEWDRLAALGLNAVWLMGVWERSPAARAESLLPEHRASYDEALPRWSADDVPGSPYAVHRYLVDDRLGGREGLARARAAMARHGLQLFLDFVPNHVAPDHPLLEKNPEFFIREGDAFAPGRDPHSTPWQDTVQLNAFSPAMRTLAANTMLEIASQCDGIRCDMAMLLLNDVFASTWGDRAGTRPEREYWTDVLPRLRERYPKCFVFAEAYWDKEWDLLQLGFDACYDKRLYDRLESGDVEAVRAHLAAPLAFQDQLIRFLENHDESRAAVTFGPGRQQAAAVILFTVPGSRLIFDGQMQGSRVRLPVRLGRAPEEIHDDALAEFYARLLHVAFRRGEWALCSPTGWPDNLTYQQILAWVWRTEHETCWVVVNYAASPSQAMVHPPGGIVPDQKLQLTDLLANVTYERDGAQIAQDGLFVSLPPWGYHFFRVARV